jgi:hypothetical protein
VVLAHARVDIALGRAEHAELAAQLGLGGRQVGFALVAGAGLAPVLRLAEQPGIAVLAVPARFLAFLGRRGRGLAGLGLGPEGERGGEGRGGGEGKGERVRVVSEGEG